MRTLLFAPFLQKYFPKIHDKVYSSIIAENIDNILKTAQQQRETILNEAALVAEEHLSDSIKQFEQEHIEKAYQLREREDKILIEQARLAEISEQVLEQESKISEQNEELEKQKELLHLKDTQYHSARTELNAALESRAAVPQTELFNNIKDVYVRTHSFDVSKISLEKQEKLKKHAHKIAEQTLNVVYHRYQPRFIWPKSSYIVNFTSSILAEKYFAEDSAIKELLLSNTDTSLNILESQDVNQCNIKIVGGLGVDKELLRLTLEECAAKKILNLDKIRAIKSKHAQTLEQQILQLGSHAAKTLHLSKVHPEILKLIGSLNYRTSHRQNQYFHSLEVATLAGMLANELGVSTELAKRSGLLHDIGKVLDYKIEGSHAVISGDYAAKYHESNDVVDTVLAHHDDKIVETPHAFILKAADAMSGARPGARVDTEDGYNRRLDGISAVIDSFKDQGVTESAIMHAGREVHVYVDIKKMSHNQLDPLAKDIAQKLEQEVEFPGQIRVTVIRRMEVTQVA